MDMQIIWCPIFPVHRPYSVTNMWVQPHPTGRVVGVMVPGPSSLGPINFQFLPRAVDAILWLISFHVIHSAKCGQLEWLGVRNWCVLTTCSQGGDFHLWASIQALGNTHRIIRQQKQPGKMKPSHFLYDRTPSQKALWNKEDFHYGSM